MICATFMREICLWNVSELTEVNSSSTPLRYDVAKSPEGRQSDYPLTSRARHEAFQETFPFRKPCISITLRGTQRL